MSSPRLMGLQLRDASFRRHFLLQVRGGGVGWGRVGWGGWGGVRRGCMGRAGGKARDAVEQRRRRALTPTPPPPGPPQTHAITQCLILISYLERPRPRDPPPAAAAKPGGGDARGVDARTAPGVKGKALEDLHVSFDCVCVSWLCVFDECV